MCLKSEYMLVRVYTTHVARVAVCSPPPPALSMFQLELTPSLDYVLM